MDRAMAMQQSAFVTSTERSASGIVATTGSTHSRRHCTNTEASSTEDSDLIRNIAAPACNWDIGTVAAMKGTAVAGLYIAAEEEQQL